MDNIYQSHKLYGHVAVISVRDRIGEYIDHELEKFRAHDDNADFRIQVAPLASLNGELHKVSELQGIQYYVHASTHESYVGYQGVYWRFEELGNAVMHVFYGPWASARWVWTVIEQWIKVSLLQRGYMAVHSCSFVYKDIPVIVAAWQGLGKSVLLHHALAQGAAYVSDDFTIISSSGEVRGYPPAVVDIHRGILRHNTSIAEHGYCYSFHRDIAKSMYAIAARIGLGEAITVVARRMGYWDISIRRVRVDMLHPDTNVVLLVSAALWVILQPTRSGTQEICADIPISDAVERIVTSTMTDYFFTAQYDKFIYQSGQRAPNDHLILDARKLYRDIVRSCLEKARDILIVDSSIALSNPDHLLQFIRNSDAKAG